MFTLGRKVLILNTDRDDIVIDATQCIIPGFCAIQIGDTKAGSGLNEPADAGTNSEGTYTIPDLSAQILEGDTIEVTCQVIQSRYISELSSDFVKQGDQIIFSSARLPAGATDIQVAAAIQAGWDNYQALYNVSYQYVTITTVGADVTIRSIREALFLTEVIRLRRVPRAAKVAPGTAVIVPASAFIRGVEKNGEGKFIEESIRTAGYMNMDPYSNRPHGSDNVDVTGKYFLYEFTAHPNGEWESHATLGTAIADQDVGNKGQTYVVYTRFVDGVTQLDATTNMALFVAAIP